ncbi:NAD/NADP-dependent octopine/nopaline dehydrogenase family protein [Calorimonas adulescens]|jgi:NAD/NADP octopine/nopaline dehydrogenase, alpha-helical domain./NAD-dependent glycerol-3-phosphate dehydrogenase N-terminus.|uniref:NADP transhydrogenase subunit alpha n=1 Tax=Calorimonas adulescens TaxID=2606906 RepID=A0A5D8QAG4_9THEO|nr:NAD/NADP-dependent octopine/nopaline dehydrogenase family protein [Calorimonas adulescens]TZE81590.1 NADP transhydrogenase subunit alpha [Calorimonas adulescens]
MKFAVIGAGNGGQAMAAHLSIMGFDVTLYNRSPEKIERLRQRGGITLEGEVEGFGTPDLTSDIREAVKDADIIMVTVPASGHRDIAYAVIPYLKDGQVIVLNPGRTGGALEFNNILRQLNMDRRVTIGEAETLIYACREKEPGTIRINSVKNIVFFATIPSFMVWPTVKMINKAYPQFVPAKNVLETSLNNIGAVFHPAPTLLNTGRIEADNDGFEYYLEGVSPSVATVLERIDMERLRVARALGIKLPSAKKWLEETYGAKGKTLYEAIQNTRAYKGIKAPATVNTRYIFEDVPNSLVPIASLGNEVGVDTPTIKSVIQLASCMHGIDYWENGRNARRLGLDGLTKDEILAYAEGNFAYEKEVSL